MSEPEGPSEEAPASGTPERGVREVLADHREEWLRLPEVTGVGVGLREGEPCLVVFVARDAAGVRGRIPESVEGWAVDLRASGQFRAGTSP